MIGLFFGARCLKRPFIYFEALRNAFFIEAISEGVKGLEIKEVAPLGSKKITEPVPDVRLFEEFFDFFMVDEKDFNYHSLLLANAFPE